MQGNQLPPPIVTEKSTHGPVALPPREERGPEDSAGITEAGAHGPLSLPPREGRTLEAQERAIVFGLYAETWLRVGMVVVIATLFGWLNHEVMALIQAMAKADQAALSLSPRPERVVTTGVLMSLIGATAIQVGVTAVTIASYLFPKNKADKL